MRNFFRILMISPRLTMAVFMMLVGTIGGVATRDRGEEPKRSNPWGKESSGGNYSAQQRADDGWGGSTPASNKRDNGRASTRTTQQVWVNKDGVIFEEEDVKALAPSEYE